MDSSSILVLVLCVGVFALLVWFEMNSRANEAKEKQSSSVAQPDMGADGKQTTNTAEIAGKKKAA